MKKLNVILLEDNIGDQLLIEECLRSTEHLNDLLIFESGDKLLNQLEQKEKLLEFKADLFLLDINLPRYSGFEILAEIRSKETPFSHFPAIMLSTSSFDNDIEKAYELGANGYMVKNSDFDKLQKNLSNLMDYWSVTMHLPEKRHI